MSDKGYIKLYRDIQDHWLWQNERFDRKSAWIDLLLMANHKDRKMLFDGELVTIKRGQILTSIRKLSARWHWSMSTVIKFLNILEQDTMITRDSNTKRTVLTLVNYEVWQSSETPTGTPSETQSETQSETRCETNKNDKNVKNDKNEKNTNRFVPPTVDEVREYVVEKNYEYVNPDDFISFYESKGWMVGKNKMKNWKASVSGWNSRAKERGDKKVNLGITQEIPERYKKIFYDMEAQFIAPYYGFPEEWFNGTRLDSSKVIPLTRPKDPSRGWYEPIEYSVKDLIEYYESRRRWNEQHSSGTQ